MRKLTKQQLEDFMVTIWKGGSNYWFDITDQQRNTINIQWLRNATESGAISKPDFNHQVSFAEKMADVLWQGFAIEVVDSEDNWEILGELTLEKINEAFNAPEMKDRVIEFIEEIGDAETTDVLVQWAIFQEIVYC